MAFNSCMHKRWEAYAKPDRVLLKAFRQIQLSPRTYYTSVSMSQTVNASAVIWSGPEDKAYTLLRKYWFIPTKLSYIRWPRIPLLKMLTRYYMKVYLISMTCSEQVSKRELSVHSLRISSGGNYCGYHWMNGKLLPAFVQFRSWEYNIRSHQQ